MLMARKKLGRSRKEALRGLKAGRREEEDNAQCSTVYEWAWLSKGMAQDTSYGIP
jgi:hypothetical protein